MKKRFLSLLLVLAIVFSMNLGLAASTDTTAAGTLADKLNGTKIQKLTDEPVTLTAWIRVDSNGATNLIDSVQDMELLQIMEEKTGVKLEIIAAPIGQESASFSLMLASSDYPDIIFNFTDFYTKGGDSAIDEGIILDLTDLVPQYAPNYEAARTAYASRQKTSVTDEGNEPFICSFNYLDQPGATVGGPMIRQDLLDKLGMATPVTYDDWYEFLSGCVNTLGLKRALGMNFDGMFKYNAFTCGFGFALDFIPFYQIDGVIQYAPLTQNYKDYLTMMAQWYAEGLVDPDFTSTITFDDGIAMATSGQTAATSDHGALLEHINNLGKEVNPDFQFVAVPNAVQNEGDIINLYQPSSATSYAVCAVSTDCKDPGLALSYIDQYYTDEGFLLANYGTEGKTFSWVDGEPVYTDLVTDNEKGSVRDVLSAYAAPTVWCYEVVTTRTAQPYTIASAAVWDSNTNKATMMPSGISLTTAENDLYADLYPEIDSYVDEMRVKYIMGLESMDTYDAFVKTLYSLGLQDVIDIYQTALDRYNNR